MKYWRFIAAALALVGVAFGQAKPAMVLSRNEARDIVLTYLKAKGYQVTASNSYLEDTRGDPDYPHLYFFIYYVDTPQRLVNNGNYAVDRRTADLWEPFGCRLATSRTIKNRQEAFRKKAMIKREELRRIRQDRPCY